MANLHANKIPKVLAEAGENLLRPFNTQRNFKMVRRRRVMRMDVPHTRQFLTRVFLNCLDGRSEQKNLNCINYAICNPEGARQ